MKRKKIPIEKLNLHPNVEALGIDKLAEEAQRGLKAHLSDNPTPFDCLRCGEKFTPAPHQWVFYNLCDLCFAPFDRQKMLGRLAQLAGKPTPYFEDVEEWVKESLNEHL